MIEVHLAISTFGKKTRTGVAERKGADAEDGFAVRSSGWQEVIIGFMLSQECGELSGVIRMFLYTDAVGEPSLAVFFLENRKPIRLGGIYGKENHFYRRCNRPDHPFQ